MCVRRGSHLTYTLFADLVKAAVSPARWFKKLSSLPNLGMGSSSSKGESGINHFHPLPTDRLARTSCGSSCSVISLSMSVRPWQRHCRRLASTTGCYVWWSPSTRMGLAAAFNCVIIGFCYMSLLLSRNCALSSK